MKKNLDKIDCNRPHVGVAVIIEDDNKVLLMRRKGAHEEGTWCFPGGKLDFFEKITDCAIRETKEEVGLTITNLRIDNKFTNDMFIREDLHYITFFVRCNAISYDAKIMQPDKCTEIGWFYWDKLPNNLFLPIINYIK